MYRILLVEDDKNIQELVCNYFTKKEKNLYKVEVASDGQIGLEKAYENNYDLLLLDVMLPELDGFEICKEIRKESDVPIMFITARANESDILGGYALGCDDYVIKPFPLPVLYEKANALIKRSKGLVRSKIFSVGSLSLNPNNGLVITPCATDAGSGGSSQPAAAEGAGPDPAWAAYSKVPVETNRAWLPPSRPVFYAAAVVERKSCPKNRAYPTKIVWFSIRKRRKNIAKKPLQIQKHML